MTLYEAHITGKLYKRAEDRKFRILEAFEFIPVSDALATDWEVEVDNIGARIDAKVASAKAIGCNPVSCFLGDEEFRAMKKSKVSKSNVTQIGDLWYYKSLRAWHVDEDNCLEVC